MVSLPRSLDHTGPTHDTWASCYTPGNVDWSLKDLYDDEGVAANPDLSRLLGHILLEQSAQVAYAPSVASCSGAIVTRDDLSTVVTLPGGAVLHRNRGLPADGVELGHGEAFVMSGVGVPILIASDNELCIVAAASRDSLLDRAVILGKEPSRPHMSVIGSIAERFQRDGRQLEKVEMSVLHLYHPDDFYHSFRHETHGDYNRALARYLKKKYKMDSRNNGIRLDLKRVIVNQARECGFAPVKFAQPLTPKGLFAHSRHITKPELRIKRNLTIVGRR